MPYTQAEQDILNTFGWKNMHHPVRGAVEPYALHSLRHLPQPDASKKTPPAQPKDDLEPHEHTALAKGQESWRNFSTFSSAVREKIKSEPHVYSFPQLLGRRNGKTWAFKTAAAHGNEGAKVITRAQKGRGGVSKLDLDMYRRRSNQKAIDRAEWTKAREEVKQKFRNRFPTTQHPGQTYEEFEAEMKKLGRQPPPRALSGWQGMGTGASAAEAEELSETTESDTEPPAVAPMSQQEEKGEPLASKPDPARFAQEVMQGKRNEAARKNLLHKTFPNFADWENPAIFADIDKNYEEYLIARQSARNRGTKMSLAGDSFQEFLKNPKQRARLDDLYTGHSWNHRTKKYRELELDPWNLAKGPSALFLSEGHKNLTDKFKEVKDRLRSSDPSYSMNQFLDDLVSQGVLMSTFHGRETDFDPVMENRKWDDVAKHLGTRSPFHKDFPIVWKTYTPGGPASAASHHENVIKRINTLLDFKYNIERAKRKFKDIHLISKKRFLEEETKDEHNLREFLNYNGFKGAPKEVPEYEKKQEKSEGTLSPIPEGSETESTTPSLNDAANKLIGSSSSGPPLLDAPPKKVVREIGVPDSGIEGHRKKKTKRADVMDLHFLSDPFNVPSAAEVHEMQQHKRADVLEIEQDHIDLSTPAKVIEPSPHQEYRSPEEWEAERRAQLSGSASEGSEGQPLLPLSEGSLPPREYMRLPSRRSVSDGSISELSGSPPGPLLEFPDGPINELMDAAASSYGKKIPLQMPAAPRVLRRRKLPRARTRRGQYAGLDVLKSRNYSIKQLAVNEYRISAARVTAGVIAQLQGLLHSFASKEIRVNSKVVPRSRALQIVVAILRKEGSVIVQL